MTNFIGFVLGTQEATPLEFWVAVSPGQILRLDDVVKVQTHRPDGAGIVHFYGVVDHVRTLYEGTQFDTDTFLITSGKLPVNVSYAAHVQVTRIEPEEYLPPQPGDTVQLALNEDLKRALHFDGMEKRIPAGTMRNSSPPYLNFEFINGEKGAHINISGVSGVATKTSYALFLLQAIFNSAALGSHRANTKALIFNVKGEDLFFIDKPNGKLREEDHAAYQTLGIPVEPFKDVRFAAAPRKGSHDVDPHLDQRADKISVYLWSIRELCRDRLFSFLFAGEDLERSNLGFLVSVVEERLSRLNRREILRQLAGVEIFEKMRQQAQKKADSLKTEYEAIERQLANLDAPAVIQVTEKKEELETLEQQLPTLNEAVLKAQKTLDEEEKLLADITRLVALQQELSALKAKDAEIEGLKVRSHQAQSADQIKANYDVLKDAKVKEKKAKTAVQSAQERLTQAQGLLAQKKAKLDEATADQKIMEPQIKARQEALAAAKIYEEQRQQHLTEVKRANKTLTQRAEALAKAEQELKSAEAEMQATTRRAKDAESGIAQYSPGGTRLEQLEQVSPLLGTWKVLQEQTQKSQHKLSKTIQEKLKADSTKKAAALKLEQAEVALKEAQSALEAAEMAKTLAMQKDHAAALRQTLHDGDSCPVCNGIYSEAQLLPLSTISLVDTTKLQNQKIAAEKAQKSVHNDLTKAEILLEKLQSKELEESQDLENSEHQLSESQQQINALVQTDSWEANALNQELKKLQESDANYHQALAKQKEATTGVLVTQQAVQSACNTHTTALAESKAATQEVEDRQHQLQEVELKLHEITNGHSYETLHKELDREQQALKQKLQEATESYQDAEKSAIKTEAEDKQTSDAAVSARIDTEQLQIDWDAALVKAEFTEESFLKAQADSAQQAKWQKAIADYHNQKLQLETRVEEVKGLIGDRTTEKSTINSRRDAKLAADEHLKQSQNRRVNLSAWIQDAESKQKQAEKLSADLSLFQEQAQIYHTLSRNLRADEFQDYILEHLQTELVDRATGLLQELTDSRYTLKVQDGEYFVEDNWNGGETRRVRTLSGGETFATSLSMALALSEKLSMGVELGSLFLDEGFGTLDADTLESVSQVLESLRQQDRLIGVITHVRALGERLPTQVKVHKSPEGSRLEVEAF